jgi:hypothetical protein
MATQTSFSIAPALAYAGMVADESPAVRWTRLAAASIGFGIGACKRSTQADDSDECAGPTQATDVTARFRGITLRDETRKNGTGYESGDPVVLLRRGLVWVEVEGAVTEDGDVYCRHTANGGNTVLGKFRADADTTNAALVPSAKFRSTTAGAGLALIELNLP